MTRRWLTLINLGAILALPELAGAQGTTCQSATSIIPDGRITTNTISAGTFYFQAAQRVGSSYSVEFHNILGAGAGQTPGTLTLFSDCVPTVVSPTNTSTVDPADPNGQRYSYTAATNQTIFRLVNTTSSMTYSFSVSETTLYSPAWSTNPSYNTYYSFLNTTGSPITGTLTLMKGSDGSVVGSPLTVTILSGTTAATNTVALGTPAYLTGTAKFTHNGPPGGILAEADVANFTMTPAYIQPVKFVPVRERAR